jgi:TusE/DsrC/DsvC family sulfur relay protein
MATKTIAGKQVEVNKEGYLTDSSQWTKEIAAEIAKQEGIPVLTDNHWKVLDYLQKEMRGTGSLPTTRTINTTGVMPTKELYELFPEGPLKKAAKIAGLAKPASCV